MSNPLVTVICLCHNHEKYVISALQSVLSQSYKKVQLIVVDDASTDGSKLLIADFIKSNPSVIYVDLKENLGHCKAFNKGFALAAGDFVIDLAADDELLPTRIETGLNSFATHDAQMGVHFCDVELIDDTDQHLQYHSDRFPHRTVPQGNIYQQIVDRYFICSPSVMIRKSVLDELSGYDESLAYEDFDLWVRSSRNYLYFYSPHVLVRKRILQNSMSALQFSVGSKQQWSTYRVCKKILLLNRVKEERAAFSKRVLYEIRLNLRLLNLVLCWRYFLLWLSNRKLM